MMDYPPGSLGYEIAELHRRIEALPWWTWFWKRRLRQNQYDLADRLARARDLFLFGGDE